MKQQYNDKYAEYKKIISKKHLTKDQSDLAIALHDDLMSILEQITLMSNPDPYSRISINTKIGVNLS